VLGDIPQRNGLGTSLLQRLQDRYNELGNIAAGHVVTLTKNYRCHTAILELVGGLFYNSHLSWADNESEPITHRNYKYPLVFICSDMEENPRLKEALSREADLIKTLTIDIAKSSPVGWGKPPMSHLFIVTPCEQQVISVCM